ncbi:glycosyltransferase family protein [Spirochaeta lutea]|uniref:Glycosyl transferase family 1 domain-containing protein n=1 Tax=Spirochaeta lutea TaxID=1480694 RepID=A0A098QTQ6_9SPIO|nr:glycosyltransferase [Spirochaeta lutea]KGE71124.1 hypothetical protein DC28_12805 [Spirochaeta lutea]
MRIAYVLTWNKFGNDGVSKKVLAQINAWRSFGHLVDLFCFGDCVSEELSTEQYLHFFPNNNVDKILGNGQAYNQICLFKPDFIYLRFEIFNMRVYHIIKSIPFVCEINSDDNKELRLFNWWEVNRLAKYLINRFTRRIILSRAKLLLAVTAELSQKKNFKFKNVPICHAPNSINMSDHPVVKDVRANTNTFQLFFLGTPNQEWHGLDIIEKIAKKLGNEYTFHVIGTYKQLNKIENIVYHGYLKKSDYIEVIRHCQAAIGTLALYRNGMTEACPLKVREYIAMGFPIIIGYTDSAFALTKPDWVLQLKKPKKILEETDAIKKFLTNKGDYVVSHDESKKYIDGFILEKNRIKLISKYLGHDA